MIYSGVGKRDTVGVKVNQFEEVASKLKMKLGLGMMAQGIKLTKQERPGSVPPAPDVAWEFPCYGEGERRLQSWLEG